LQVKRADLAFAQPFDLSSGVLRILALPEVTYSQTTLMWSKAVDSVLMQALVDGSW
jgi:hypothetical protein